MKEAGERRKQLQRVERKKISNKWRESCRKLTYSLSLFMTEISPEFMKEIETNPEEHPEEWRALREAMERFEKFRRDWVLAQRKAQKRHRKFKVVK